jgi:hypothetical protein
MGVEPPFIYDRPSAYTFGNPTNRAFDPKAASRASWQPPLPKPKQNGPLIDFNKHPDSVSHLHQEPWTIEADSRNSISLHLMATSMLSLCTLEPSLESIGPDDFSFSYEPVR